MKPQNWSTPRWLFDALHKTFEFTVDVCAEGWNAKLDRFYGPEGEHPDGLAASWRNECVFMNPPYASIDPWVDKALAYDVDIEGAMLLPSRTDRRWFHRINESRLWRIEFLPFRLNFEGPPDVKVSSSPFPVFVAYRWNREYHANVRKLLSEARVAHAKKRKNHV